MGRERRERKRKREYDIQKKKREKFSHETKTKPRQQKRKTDPLAALFNPMNLSPFFLSLSLFFFSTEFLLPGVGCGVCLLNLSHTTPLGDEECIHQGAVTHTLQADALINAVNGGGLRPKTGGGNATV